MKDDRTLEECLNDLKRESRKLLEEIAESLGIYKLLDWLESKL